MIEPVTGEQIKQERAIFNKAWEFIKKYYNIQPDSPDEDWKAFLDDAKAISELQTGSSKPSEFSKQITLAIMDHIELIGEDRRKRGYNDSD